MGLNHLELANGPAKLPPFFGIANCRIQAGLSQTDHGKGNDASPHVQTAQGNLHSHAFVPQPIGGRNAAIFKHHLGEHGRMHPHFRNVTHLIICLASFRQKHGDPLTAFAFVYRGKNTQHICHTSVGDQGFGSVDDVRIAVADRGGLQGTHVRAHIWLRKTECPRMIQSHQRPQELLTLLICPELADDLCHKV